jgi:hypothetical protein
MCEWWDAAIERLSSLVSLGAELFAADISNKEAMTRAFRGAEAAYVMIPPDLGNPEYAAYQDKVIEATASALDQGAPRRFRSRPSQRRCRVYRFTHPAPSNHIRSLPKAPR